MTPASPTPVSGSDAGDTRILPGSSLRRAADLERVATIAAALLIGLGLIMWIAGNWDGLGRYGRFAVAGSALASAVAGSLLLPRLRTPFLLVAHLAVGGLLALIGQTYQTGADPWSLFAIWAALSLPFAIAARSDAVWSGWIIVAMAGVSLWSRNQGAAFFGLHADLQGVLMAWAILFALCLPFSPWSPVRKLIGQTRWSWLIATMLALGQIVLPALGGLFAADHLVIFFIALGLVATILLLVTGRSPADLPAAALFGIALDVLLIAGVVRFVFMSGQSEIIGGSLIVGLVSAGIVAATATSLMRLHREQTPAAPLSPASVSDEPDGVATPPWPIMALTAFGAGLAAIPLLVFYAFVLMTVVGEKVLTTGLLVPGLGVVTLGVAVMMLRSSRSGLFAEVMAMIFALVGAIQIGFGAFRDLPPHLAAMALVVLLGVLALLVPQRWIRLLLGLPASKLASIAVAGLLLPGSTPAWYTLMRPGATPLIAIFDALVTAAVVLLLLRPELRMARLVPFLTGWIVGALLNLASISGPTLLAGAFGPGLGPGGGLQAGLPNGSSLVALLVALAVLWAGRRRADWRTPLLMAHGLALTLLAVFVPALSVPAFVSLVMLAEGRRRLALLAAVVGLWILGAFYYSLAWPLVTKGLGLIALGSVLIGLAAVLGRNSLHPASGGDVIDASSAGGRWSQMLVAGGAICVIGLCGFSILSKEHVMRTGRTVLVRIVPVDPRSLVQGDYMTLAFELPQRSPPVDAARWGGPQPVAIGRIGAGAVVTFDEIAIRRPELAPDQVAVALSVKSGRYVVGSDAWFFTEGTAERWTNARYGIFRVTADGTALLAGLADEARQPIR